jgi:hypothetical protein
MKGYTDLSQSKKLAEFLPLESADMYIYKNIFFGALSCFNGTTQVGEYVKLTDKENKAYPCWSLAALLSVIRKIIGYTIYGVNDVYISCELGDKPWQVETQTYDNEVDAAYEMIIKLHEQNIL